MALSRVIEKVLDQSRVVYNGAVYTCDKSYCYSDNGKKIPRKYLRQKLSLHLLNMVDDELSRNPPSPAEIADIMKRYGVSEDKAFLLYLRHRFKKYLDPEYLAKLFADNTSYMEME